jgi:hypothetical protein
LTSLVIKNRFNNLNCSHNKLTKLKLPKCNASVIKCNNNNLSGIFRLPLKLDRLNISYTNIDYLYPQSCVSELEYLRAVKTNIKSKIIIGKYKDKCKYFIFSQNFKEFKIESKAFRSNKFIIDSDQ